MKVELINSNDRRNNTFATLTKGAVAGAAVGYVSKYALPLTQEEKNSDEYIKVTSKIRNNKNAFNIRTASIINELKERNVRSLAEDEYVKLFDGMKEGDKVKTSRIIKAIKTLEAKNPKEALAFKKMCKEACNVAKKSAKQCERAYNLVTKHLRPTAFFVATGALVGGFATTINNLLKTDVEH
jgi:hypothetical protein